MHIPYYLKQKVFYEQYYFILKMKKDERYELMKSIK